MNFRIKNFQEIFRKKIIIIENKVNNANFTENLVFDIRYMTLTNINIISGVNTVV